MACNLKSSSWGPDVGHLQPVGSRNQPIAGDQTRRAAAVRTLNILLPKFHALLTIRSGEVSGPYITFK